MVDALKSVETVVARLNRFSLGQFKPFFQSLLLPEILPAAGIYKSIYIGPWWLRRTAGIALWPLGLGGWCGKRFLSDGTGVNLVRRKGLQIEKMPMSLTIQPSLFDGENCIAVSYLPGSRFPWTYIQDDLRMIDDQCFLGLTHVNKAFIPQVVFPFLLVSTNK